MIYEYATKSWPVVKGCDMTLSCAARCWASRQCHRLADNPNQKIAEFHQGLTDERGHWTGTVKLNEAHLGDPIRWRKPEVVAVAYHGDLFLAPDDVIDRVFSVMALCPQHTFLVLTKRPERMLQVMTTVIRTQKFWPMRNVWLGVSVTNQADADERIPWLLQTPAAHRWLSIEPMVGAVNLGLLGTCPKAWGVRYSPVGEHIDGVVLGGESGPGARPMHPDWVRTVRDQCAEAGVPFFFKQWGEWAPKEHFKSFEEWNAASAHGMVRVGKEAAGHLLDGKEHRELAWGVK